MSQTEISRLPHLRKNGNVWQLYIQGKRRLLYGGEVHNSSASSAEWMAPIWRDAQAAHFNVMLAPVPWDLLEPEEGQFDFTQLDELIDDARAHGMYLIPLWFGSWKNGATHYAPLWVKKDTERFPRIRTVNGNAEVLTPLSDATLDADMAAFTALMRHIHERDAEQNTVPLVQVQNEVGLLGDLRDRSEEAEALFHGQVPGELIEHLVRNEAVLLPETLKLWRGRRQSGTWSEVFGDDADETFMSWHYARFCNADAVAGKREHDLPMFVNPWLKRKWHKVAGGGYPSGGPVIHMQDIWRAGAPDIDILAPDIHTAEVDEAVNGFNRGNNPFFIPESRNEAEGASIAYYSFGKGCFGFSPYGFETRNADLVGGPLAQSYRLLEDVEPLILEHQEAGTITGARVSPEYPEMVFDFGGYRWTAIRHFYWKDLENPVTEYGYAVIMQLAPNAFYLAGYGIQFKLETIEKCNGIVGIGSVDEGKLVNGKWVRGRRLSGSEIMQTYDIPTMLSQNQTGTQVKLPPDTPKLMKVTLYTYPRF
jgi:hypothetical protein